MLLFGITTQVLVAGPGTKARKSPLRSSGIQFERWVGGIPVNAPMDSPFMPGFWSCALVYNTQYMLILCHLHKSLAMLIDFDHFGGFVRLDFGSKIISHL
jgi:hypothetical protein